MSSTVILLAPAVLDFVALALCAFSQRRRPKRLWRYLFAVSAFSGCLYVFGYVVGLFADRLYGGVDSLRFTPVQGFAIMIFLSGALLSAFTFLTAFVGTAVVLTRRQK